MQLPNNAILQTLNASNNPRAKDGSITGRNRGENFGTGGNNGNGGMRGGSLTGPNTSGACDDICK